MSLLTCVVDRGEVGEEREPRLLLVHVHAKGKGIADGTWEAAESEDGLAAIVARLLLAASVKIAAA